MEASGASRSFLSLPGEQASRRSSGSRPRRSGRRGGRLTVTGSLCALVPLHLILSARPQLLRLPMASANAISTASLLRPLSQVICARPAGEELRPPHLRWAEELRRPARAWGGASLPCSKRRGASGSAIRVVRVYPNPNPKFRVLLFSGQFQVAFLDTRIFHYPNYPNVQGCR